MSKRPSKDEIFRVLIEFFLDEYSADHVGVCDWLVQGEQDEDQFIHAVQRLKYEFLPRE